MRSFRGPAALALGAVCVAPAAPGDLEPPRTECRTQVHGSTAAAVCHNPDPVPDRVRLHIECRRWWDPDVDTRPAEVGPARTVTLSGRCWKEVDKVWVTRTATRLPDGGAEVRD